MSSRSSRHRTRWSQAVWPFDPSRILPGVAQKRSQLQGSRRSADPSIWKAEVATPNRRSGERIAESAGTEISGVTRVPGAVPLNLVGRPRGRLAHDELDGRQD